MQIIKYIEVIDANANANQVTVRSLYGIAHRDGSERPDELRVQNGYQTRL